MNLNTWNFRNIMYNLLGLRYDALKFSCFTKNSMSDEHTTTLGEEDDSDYVVEPRGHTMRPLKREHTCWVTYASRESTDSPSASCPSTSRAPTTSRRERDPEDEPAWLSPLEFDVYDLHYDLRHHVVSHFPAGVVTPP